MMEYPAEHLFDANPLSEQELAKLQEATRLLDETYALALQEDSYQKSYDGTIQVNISYGTHFGRVYGESLDGKEFTKPEVTFTIWSYIIGDEKQNEFNNADDLLATVKRWNIEEKQRAEGNKG